MAAEPNTFRGPLSYSQGFPGPKARSGQRARCTDQHRPAPTRPRLRSWALGPLDPSPRLPSPRSPGPQPQAPEP